MADGTRPPSTSTCILRSCCGDGIRERDAPLFRWTRLDSCNRSAFGLQQVLRALSCKVGSRLGKRLAEREGFEPPIPVKVCLISSQVHSTALPSLRAFIINRLGCFVKTRCLPGSAHPQDRRASGQFSCTSRPHNASGHRIGSQSEWLRGAHMCRESIHKAVKVTCKNYLRTQRSKS